MVHYTKIQSNGNNFLIFDNREGIDHETLTRLTIRDCNVKTGIGADGILVIENAQQADFKMRIINSNGFESEMCGNGARCIARYAHEHGLANASMTFETLAGIISAEVDGVKVKIGMGEYDISDIHTIHTLIVDELPVSYHFMVVGVPHVVIFYEEGALTREDMIRIGRSFDENHSVFPRGTNVNFVMKMDESTIKSTTYERGVEDITDSCGTGSCASAVLADLSFNIKSPVKVINPGGTNTVYFQKNAISTVQIALEGDVFYCGEITCAL
jgi:diaminopimelate epimerase